MKLLYCVNCGWVSTRNGLPGCTLMVYRPDRLDDGTKAGAATRMCSVFAWLMTLWQGWMSWVFGRPEGLRRAPSTPSAFIPATKRRCRPKPPWVRRELVRLRAWSPELGCRTLAEVFNRRFAERGMSVSKSHVADVLRRAAAEVARIRQEGKHRVPRPMPKNRVWAMDLTGKADLTGRQHLMLGLLDHGSRACLRLEALTDKRALTILRELLVAFRRFGIPRCIRVDNEACFNARSMEAALALLGVRLQTTALHCPWQNGRIERFFGTLKRKLDHIAIVNGDDLHTRLVAFRAWYNHARPHQHLGGHTPAEVWNGRPKSTKRPRYVSLWGGHITGWFFPP